MTYPEALAFLQSFTNYEVLPAVAHQAANFELARVAARHLAGEAEAAFTGADMSTKLKLMGVDVASIGDAPLKAGLLHQCHAPCCRSPGPAARFARAPRT